MSKAKCKIIGVFVVSIALVGSSFVWAPIPASETAAQKDEFPFGAITAKCDPEYTWPFVGCEPWDGVTVHFQTTSGLYKSSCITTSPDTESSVAGCSVNVPFSYTIFASIDPNVIPEGYILQGSDIQEITIPDGPPEGVFGQATFVLLPTGTESPTGSTSSQCTLVELRPGYPGYRGYVTGISGAGEAACREELEAIDPQFSKEEEDSENVAAALRLGITGSPEEWVWETWMAIHAERGLDSVCYVCIWTSNDPNPPPTTRVQVLPSDPRLQLSSFGTRDFAFSFAGQHGLAIPISPEGQGYVLPTDDELRAIAALWSPNSFPTASQLVVTASEWLELYAQEPFIPNYGAFHDAAIQRGGYYPGSGGMTFDDQFYLLDHPRAMHYWFRSGALAGPWFTAMQSRVGRQQSGFFVEYADGHYLSYSAYVTAWEA